MATDEPSLHEASEKSERAVERLRASKRLSDLEAKRVGSVAGCDWAVNRAEAFELERLTALFEANGHDWDQFFFGNSPEWTVAERLYYQLHPESDGEREAAQWFWVTEARANGRA